MSASNGNRLCELDPPPLRRKRSWELSPRKVEPISKKLNCNYNYRIASLGSNLLIVTSVLLFASQHKGQEDVGFFL